MNAKASSLTAIAHAALKHLNYHLGFGFLGSLPTDIWSRAYTHALRGAGATIGARSAVHWKVHVWHPENLSIGQEVRIPASCDLAGMAPVTIGDRTQIGAGVRFITNFHPFDDPTVTEIEQRRGYQYPIGVGSDCWIMNNVILVAKRGGLTIGEGAWLAAGAIVTRNVPPRELWAGVPARLVRRLAMREQL